MKYKSPAFIVYVISGLLFFLSAILNNEFIALFSKPIISSSILFYYWQESRSKINLWYALILTLLFFSGILNLFDDGIVLKYVILTNLVVYCILLGFIVKSLFEKTLKMVDNVNLSFIIIMFLFLASLLYLCLFQIFDKTSELYLYIIVYSCVLTTLGLLNTVLFIINNKSSNVYLMIATFCYIICDSFYVIYYYYYNFIFFRYFSILANIISFYFLVNYFLLSNQKEEVFEIDL